MNYYSISFINGECKTGDTAVVQRIMIAPNERGASRIAQVEKTDLTAVLGAFAEGANWEQLENSDSTSDILIRNPSNSHLVVISQKGQVVITLYLAGASSFSDQDIFDLRTAAWSHFNY